MALGSGNSSNLIIHVCIEVSAGRRGLHLGSAGVAPARSKLQELTALAHICRRGKSTSKIGRGINPCQVSRFPPDALGGVWESPLSGPPLRAATFGPPPPLGPHPCNEGYRDAFISGVQMQAREEPAHSANLEP